jgi:copper chaperone CopZ
MTAMTRGRTGGRARHSATVVAYLVGVCDVSAATVDLTAGTVTVTYDAPAQRTSIEAAIADAGYEVAGAKRVGSS